MTDYPNLRRLAEESKGPVHHYDEPDWDDLGLLAYALLAALDTMQGGCANCAAGDHDCKGGDCWCGCRRLAALEQEAGE